MTDRSTWKKQELRVAKALGGDRIPCSGSAQFREEKGDVLHPVFEIECKYSTRPFRVVSLLKTVMGRAKVSKKTPILVIREKHTQGDYVVIKLEDLAKLYYGVIGAEFEE